MLPQRDPETVNSVERASERKSSPPNFSKVPQTRSEVLISRVKNFTCPGCQVVLEEAVSINGVVQGWCGNSHTFIKVPAT